MTELQIKRVLRAAELLHLASAAIRDNCPEIEIFYDETTCDGYCLADDCQIQAEMMEELLLDVSVARMIDGPTASKD